MERWGRERESRERRGREAERGRKKEREMERKKDVYYYWLITTNSQIEVTKCANLK